jgi:hypothetical protein
MSRQSTGAAGELVVQARLIVRGWTTGNVNTGGMMNAPAIDLFAAKQNKTIKIAVKATGHGQSSVQWNKKPGTTTLFKGDVHPDFVIFAWFSDIHNLDQCRIFVVPASVVDQDVMASHEHWHSYKKRDGMPRKDSGHVSVNWDGNDTATNISHGFAVKWKKYEEAWHLLEQFASSKPQ